MSGGPIAWFAQNRVAANLLMWLLILGGLLSAPAIPQLAFPDSVPNIVSVLIEYRGASPEEMEGSVCTRIEEAVNGMEGIDTIESVARESVCATLIILLEGTDQNLALDRVKQRIDAIDTFPDEAEQPEVALADVRREILQIAITGSDDEAKLKRVAKDVRKGLARLPGVKDVFFGGVRPDEISIELSQTAVRHYGLSFDAVANAVRGASLDLPAGTLRTDGGEVVLRTDGEARTGAEFEELVVVTRSDGTRLRLRDVARVVDGFEDAPQEVLFEGKPAVNLVVERGRGVDSADLSEAARAHLARVVPVLPEGIELHSWKDESKRVHSRTSLMIRNGRAGLSLVLLLLAIFLRPRVALWVALGMPIAMLGAVFVFQSIDYSLNMNTMLSFIVVLGILVDDAIVVGEGVYRRQEAGEAPLDAAINGTRDVSVPVIFGVLTTAVAFLPFLMLDGPMRSSSRPIGVVVLLCLFFSLVESQLILPAHLGHGRSRDDREGDEPKTRFGARWLRLQDRSSRWLTGLANGRFRQSLEICMQWRYVTLAVGLSVLAIALAMPLSGRLRFGVFPKISTDAISGRISMPPGVPFEATQRAVGRLVEAAQQLREELDPGASPDEATVRTIVSAAGDQPFQHRDHLSQMSGTWDSGSNTGEVMIMLSSGDDRARSSHQIAQRWRELAGPIPGIEELIFSASLVSFGDPIDLELSHPDMTVLEEVSRILKNRLAEYPGVTDIADSQRNGKEEIRLAITPAGQTLGLGLRDLARQVRQAFYGEEVQRIQRGRDDVRVMVRYPEHERRSLYQLEDLRIHTADGVAVPFSTVAEVSYGRAPVEIRRSQGRRVVRVSAGIDRRVASEGTVLADLSDRVMPQVVAQCPGLEWSFQGAQRAGMQATASLFRWALIALFVIYALLAVPLRSYVQPLVIMAIIPFGIAGALFGHVVMGMFHETFGLTMLSFLGAVALTGVVVNSGLVLVHNVNRRLQAGVPVETAVVETAVVEAAVERFRPIVLTSATTFAGLSPILFESSSLSQFILPITTSLAFGVVFATTVSLLLLPCIYLILRDLTRLVGRERSTEPAEVPEGARPPPIRLARMSGESD